MAIYRDAFQGAGGDLDAIGVLLRSLPGSEVVCHTVAISVFRSKRQES